MRAFLSTVLLLATPAAAQTVGGGYETIHHWFGEAKDSNLGNSVSGAGDVNADGFDDLIIGSHLASPGGLTSAGSAFVLSGADGSLLYRWDGAEAFDVFGSSVSGAGDINADGFDDLIVGTIKPSHGALTWAGSAYVYSGADGSLMHHWKGNDAGDHFGRSVSGAGDINADGYDDMIIGSTLSEDPGYPDDAGSAHAVSGKDGTLIYKWRGDVTNAGHGWSVSGAGDVNADGYADLIVSSPFDQADAGAVFVYSGFDGTLIYQWNGQQAGDRIGLSVSDAGDVNDDGFDDVIIGAEVTSMSAAGSAFVYSGLDGSLLYQWDGEVAGNKFGGSVSAAGDINGDGFDDLIIGASNGSSSGSAYVYSGADGALLHKWVGKAPGEHFGQSVSGAGDVNADGLADVVVGNPGTDHNDLRDKGSASVLNHFSDYVPYLVANTPTISASAGGTLNLDLNFPQNAGFEKYKVVLCETPGSYFWGVNIPIFPDQLAWDTFTGHYPVPVHTDLQGTLDTNGDATASLTVPGGISSSFVGSVYYIVAIANPPGQLPEYSSAAINLTIVP